MIPLQNWKRWLTWLLLATLFAVACVFLSQWQFSRRAEAVAKMRLIEANYDQQPANIHELASLQKFDPANEWRPVELSGEFLVDDAVLVRNRPYNGQAGFLQVVPFRLSTGEVVAIETGWLATANDNAAPKQVPLPSNEPTTIIARLRSAEPTLGRDAPAGQIATINIDALKSKTNLSAPVFKKLYARLATSYSNSETPKILPKPELSEGNHLSYAVQWIVFALMAFIALWWAIKQESNARRMKIDPNFKPKVRKKLGDEDKNVEDSILKKN